MSPFSLSFWGLALFIPILLPSGWIKLKWFLLEDFIELAGVVVILLSFAVDLTRSTKIMLLLRVVSSKFSTPSSSTLPKV